MPLRAIVVLVIAFGAPASTAFAQHATPTAANRAPAVDGWIMGGVDAGLGRGWRGSVAFGHLGGFESRIVLTEATMIVDAPWRLLLGYVYVQPFAAGSSSISIARAGGVWLPVRGRLSLDNRVLAERWWGEDTRIEIRARDRVRVTWLPADGWPLRLFGTLEAFVAPRRGFVERRYQAGIARLGERASVEAFWLRSEGPGRTTFDLIGATIYWRAAP